MDRARRALARGLPGARLRRRDFVRFFHQASPIDALTELNIGSRPASRKAGGRLEDAARDPVGVRVDAEPAAAAVLVRRRHRAGGGRPRAPARDVRSAGRSSAWPARRWRWRSSRPTSAVGRRYLALVDDALADRFWPALEAEHARVVGAAAGDPRRRGAARRRTRAARPRSRTATRWVDPLSHLQVELLAPLAGRRRDRRRRAAGHDRRHRGGYPQHGVGLPALKRRQPALADARQRDSWRCHMGGVCVP